mmetsp:Transcript_72007/g.204367  ORF Transcript_72007/g.204367 Transcript_72007/m.204367 type:complete len:316 (-) Transcript_72007:112-1059(-)
MMPSFESGSERAKYTIRHLPTRAAKVADILYLQQTDFVQAAVKRVLRPGCELGAAGAAGAAEDDAEGERRCNVMSLGGGPGFDFLSMALLSDYVGGVGVDALVLDYEAGWEECVESVAEALGANGFGVYSAEDSGGGGQRRRHRCTFGECDITQALDHPSNVAVQKYMAASTVFVAAYVVEENRLALRRNGYIFFRNIMQVAQPGSLFVFTETTHRQWPDIVQTAMESCGDECAVERAGVERAWDFVFPRVQGKRGNQLVMVKNAPVRPASSYDFCSTSAPLLEDETWISEREREQLVLFKRDDEMHQARVGRVP